MIASGRALGVLGAGSWGTALAIHLARANHRVRLWARSEELARSMAREHRNPAYLPDTVFPELLEPTSDAEDLAECTTTLVVVPSHGFRSVLRAFLGPWSERHPESEALTIISGTKGIEQESLARMSQVCFEEGLAVNHEVRFAVLSGPTFAAELAQGAPTACVVASENPGLAESVRDLFSWGNLRLYSTSDVVGVELGGTAKNVIAIAAGCVDGLEYGSNTLAALITRGLHEIMRLGVSCGGHQRTFSGLAGLGDLVLTCTGGLSRNRRTGVELAHGKTLAQITAETSMVAEGVRNSLTILELARQRGVEMPITEQMVEVLHHDKPPREAVEKLMSRDLKAETEL